MWYATYGVWGILPHMMYYTPLMPHYVNMCGVPVWYTPGRTGARAVRVCAACRTDYCKPERVRARPCQRVLRPHVSWRVRAALAHRLLGRA